MDAQLQQAAPDAAASLDPLQASLQGDSAQSEVLREGLAVGQGKWPPDRCDNNNLLDLFTCIWLLPEIDVTHTPLMVMPEHSSLDSFDLLVDSPSEIQAHIISAPSAPSPCIDPLHHTLRRLLKNLPDSLGVLLDQASQSFAAQASKALPKVASQHQAVQQELILGEADRWRRLLVRLLPSLKQVRCHCLCPSRLLKTLTFMAQGRDLHSLSGGIHGAGRWQFVW